MSWTPVMETKRLGVALADTGNALVIEGYASLFGVVDLCGDVVERGAFANSLRRRGANAIRLLFQHDPAEPIGRWDHIVEDVKGLRVRGSLNLAVGRAREVAALLRQEAIDGLSIGFKTIRAKRQGGLRRLSEIDLWEISVVTFPMLPDARVTPSVPPNRKRATSLPFPARPPGSALGAARGQAPAEGREPGPTVRLAPLPSRLRRSPGTSVSPRHAVSPPSISRKHT